MIHRSPHLLILIAVLGLGTIWLTRLGVQRFESQMIHAARETDVPTPRPSVPPRGRSANPSSPGPSSAVNAVRIREALRKLSGAWLEESAQLEFTPEGRLSSLRQKSGPRSVQGYDAAQASHVLSRARSFLGEAAGLLSAAPGTSFGDETVRADPHQGDVFFRQMAQGIPLAPQGSLSLTFGSGGELKALAADLVPGPLEVTGGFQLSSEVASRAATEVLTQELQGAIIQAHEIKGGARRIWVQSREDGTFEGRPAYEFVIRGRKVVIDAQSGVVLLKRDKRIF